LNNLKIKLEINVDDLSFDKFIYLIHAELDFNRDSDTIFLLEYSRKKDPYK